MSSEHPVFTGAGRRTSAAAQAGAAAAVRPQPLRWAPLPAAGAPSPAAGAAAPVGAAPSRPLEAEREAASVLARARADAAAVLEAAEAEAVARGARVEAEARVRGRQQGEAEAREQAAALLAEARRVRDQAERDRQAVMDAIVADVAQLAMDIARQVLERELEQSPDDIVRLTRRMLQRVESPARVRVHPTLATVLEAEAGTLGRAIEVRADASVEPGGLVIESEEGELDATVDGRLGRVAAVLEEGGRDGA